MTVIYAFLAIGIIIFLHELGHFMAAKFVGVPVERFALGFDPYKLRLFSFKPGEYIEFLGRFRISLGASNAAGTDSQAPDQSANGTASPAASSPETARPAGSRAKRVAPPCCSRQQDRVGSTTVRLKVRRADPGLPGAG